MHIHADQHASAPLLGDYEEGVSGAAAESPPMPLDMERENMKGSAVVSPLHAGASTGFVSLSHSNSRDKTAAPGAEVAAGTSGKAESQLLVIEEDENRDDDDDEL